MSKSELFYYVPGSEHLGIPEPMSPGTVIIRSPAEAMAVSKPNREEAWVFPSSDAIELGLVSKLGNSPWHRLLVLDEIPQNRLQLLKSFFGFVISRSDPIHFLPLEELIDLLASENRCDLFIGIYVDEVDGVVVLYRGNFKALVVPTAWFNRSGDSPQPDFSDVGVTDWGQTVRFGEYEAAADTILYEFDPVFRRRDKKRWLDQDKTIGGSIRRLRLQKRRILNDFVNISGKEVGRIERGEVNPTKKSLEMIATELGVSVSDLSTF